MTTCKQPGSGGAQKGVTCLMSGVSVSIGAITHDKPTSRYLSLCLYDFGADRSHSSAGECDRNKRDQHERETNQHFS